MLLLNISMYNVIIFTENTDNIQFAIPLGAYKVASVLRKHGYSTLVINHLSFYKMDELKQVLDYAIGSETFLLGISTTFLRKVEEVDGKREYSLMDADTLFPQGRAFEDEIIAYAKSKNENLRFMVGGGKATTNYENPNIDYVFIGYSEASIIDLANHLTLNTELPNTSVNSVGSTIIDDRKATRYDFTKDTMVWEKTDVINHKVLPIETGRGCIFRCKFCSFPLNGKKSLDYIKEADLIYEELLDNYTKFGIIHYFIVDDTFNDHILKLKAIEDAVKRLPFQPFFWCYTRLDLLCTNPEMVDVMYRIGVRAMYFGIETLNKETGLIIGKGYDRAKQISMIEHIRDTYPDVAMHGSFIAGLPKEPYDSIKLTCDQLANGEIPLNSWMIRPLIIMPPETMSFTSDINLNYESYGYRITQKTEQNVLIWENDNITFEQAWYMTEDSVRDSRTNDFFKVPGHDAFELVNVGYDLQETLATPHKDFTWDEAQYERAPKFIQDYKDELLVILRAQVVER